jgi:hypothetical protein
MACTPFSTGAADEGLRAQYTFTQDSPSAGIGQRFRVQPFADGDGLPPGDTNQFPVPYLAIVDVTIAADGSTATFHTFDVDFVDSPVVVAGQVDLGFHGVFPYRLENK